MAKQRLQSNSKAPLSSNTGTAARTSPPLQRGLDKEGDTEKSINQDKRGTDKGAEKGYGYFDAVALYEQGLQALQRHDYDRAVSLLESVLKQYPEEKELHERVRLYLSICARQAAPREPAPQTVDELLYAATLAINGGKYDEAISHLRLVRDEDPDNDHALYMLAVAHAQRDEHAEAIAHLERAIALNPENRAMARRDPDLEPIREDDAFRGAVDTGNGQRFGLSRRRPFKVRTSR
jgi:outer membrane protein assembly factor BamD (BamD/ComL family)